MRNRPLDPADVAACVAVGTAAWQPVYAEVRARMGDDLFRRLHPDHDRPQAAEIERLATDDERLRLVAVDGDEVVGFVIAYPELSTGLGHVSTVVVAPQHQGRGIGTELASQAFAELRRAGLVHALAITLDVPAHAPARRVLSKVGLESMSMQPVQFVLPLDGVEDAPAPPGARPFAAGDLARCRALALEAFRPVFASFERGYGRDLLPRLRPGGEEAHADEIAAACADPGHETWVLERDGGLVAFLVLIAGDRGIGRLYLLGVDPAYQRRGIGTALNRFALGRMAEQGMVYAVVGTGNDPGHAAARASYLAVGFRPWPVQWDMLGGELSPAG